MTNFARRHGWVWAGLGVLILWAMLSVASNRFSLNSLSGVAASASFLAIAATGQMFAISTGGGNVDLSIANVITLAAFAVMTIAGGNNTMLLAALPVVVLVGVAVGCVNAFLIVRLRIPAIIATLAVGYVLATATLLANRVGSSFAVSPLLAALAVRKVAGVPTILLVAAMMAAVAGLVLTRTTFGRTLMAVGQNRRAADLAGIDVARVTTVAFVVSGALAAVDGALLSAYAGGAFLGMGSIYLLQSVGAVVVGGTPIFGGTATPLGTFLGSFLLVLIVTTLQIMGLAGGAQDVVQGLVIIGVLSAAGGLTSRRRR